MQNYLTKGLISSIRILSLGAIALAASSCGSPDHKQSGTAAEKTTGSAPSIETIHFGIYAADKASKVVEQFGPTIRELEKVVSKKLERPIKIRLQVSEHYETGIRDITSGKVHFSRLGPASFITAKKENPELSLLAMESKKGKRSSTGIIAIHRDSKISSIKDLGGKSFAFGDSLSTIGRYLAQTQLLDAGLNSSDLATFKYLGRHDKVGMAVAAGEYDAGALKESTFKSLVEAGHPIKELLRFPNVTKPWVAHPSLNVEITEALSAAFLEMGASSMSKDGFLAAEDHYYEPIRVAMASAEAF